MTPTRSVESGDDVRQKPCGKFIRIKLSGVVPRRAVQPLSHFAEHTATEAIILFGRNPTVRYPLRINRSRR
jgi:hypothetical protein